MEDSLMTRIRLKLEGMPIHGSKPEEGWSVKQYLTKDTAAEMVKAPEYILYKEHLWANNGYIVIDLLNDYSEDKVKPGMQCVYHIDSEYLLLEKI